jgi:hypothetical protein
LDRAAKTTAQREAATAGSADITAITAADGMACAATAAT